MTLRGTVSMAAVLAMLVAYLVAVGERGGPPAPAALLAKSEADVERVEVAQGAARHVLVRHDGGWDAAGGGSVDTGRVHDLLAALATLRPLDVVDPSPTDAAAYGLGPDAAQLRIVGAEGRLMLELEIGARNPAGTALYVRRDRRPEVLLVGSLLRWELEKVQSAVSGAAEP